MNGAIETEGANRELARCRGELRLLQDQLARQDQELAAAHVELRRLHEIKSWFVVTVAHELRTPLTTIGGYLEMLLDEEFGPLADDQREPLEIAHTGVRCLWTVSESLLDVIRIEAEEVELALRPIDLPALVETVAATFRPQLETRAQCLMLRAAPDLPPALCDETRAAQITGVLLSHTSEYAPRGGQIHVHTTLADEGGFVQVSVAEPGMGISEGRARLSSRTLCVEDAGLTEVGHGSLGLYIARSLAELHGGRLWFESGPDKGATFHVTFPIAHCSQNLSENPGVRTLVYAG